MLLLFTFCLCYVINQRRYQWVTSSPSPDAYDSLVSTGDSDLETSTIRPQTTFIGFSDYRFILSIVLLVLVGLLSIPIYGLTGFHMFLIAQGRTTNEQVTGKYHQQVDAFTDGCWKNCLNSFCRPLYPQMKSPDPKRYDLELFERMAYGKTPLTNGKKSSTKKVSTTVTYKPAKEEEHDEPNRSAQPERKKRKVTRKENGEKRTTPQIHVNPIQEKSRDIDWRSFVTACHRLLSAAKTRPRSSKKQIKIPREQVSDDLIGHDSLLWLLSNTSKSR